MAKYNTFMNELPENDTSDPWVKVSGLGTAAIKAGKLVIDSNSDGVYRRIDGQAASADVDIRMLVKWTEGFSTNQYIYIDDGSSKLIEIIISDLGIKINGSSFVYALAKGVYHPIRITKTAQTEVSLYVSSFSIAVDTLAYASIPTATAGTAKVEWKLGANANQTVTLEYLNYAIGEDADEMANTRVNTLMGRLPHEDQTDTWSLGSDLGSKLIENGHLVVRRDGGTAANVGYARTSDTFSAADEIDVVFRTRVAGNVGSFSTYINDGTKQVLVTVERTVANGYRCFLNSEVPQVLTDGFHSFRVVKSGTAGVKLYLDDAATPLYSVSYASLSANATKKIEIILTAGNASSENKVSVDHYNYGFNVDAFDPISDADTIHVMKIQPETGVMQEHDPQQDGIEFENVKSKKFKSDGDMVVKTEGGDLQLYSTQDISFVSHITEYIPDIGNPDAIIGGAYYVGDSATEVQPVKFASTVDGTYALPIISGIQPNSILHAFTLLTQQSVDRKVNFLAGEDIPAGVAVRLSSANTVVVASNTSLSGSAILGIAEVAAASGETVLVTLPGGIAENVISDSVNVNDILYLDTDGTTTDTLPIASGSIVLRLGYAATTTNLFISVGEPYVRS